jgi:hypothetical protein
MASGRYGFVRYKSLAVSLGEDPGNVVSALDYLVGQGKVVKSKKGYGLPN